MSTAWTTAAVFLGLALLVGLCETVYFAWMVWRDGR